MSGRPGDFSRSSFDPQKHYSGVLMQQGRVQLDADWNEQLDIIAHRLRAQVLDSIGPSGAPAGSPGFEIVPRAALRFDGTSQYLTLGHAPSRLYADAPALRLELEINPRPGGPGGAVVCRFDCAAEGEALRFTYALAVESDGVLSLRRAVGRELRSERAIAFGRWSRVTLSHDLARCAFSIDGHPAGSLDEGLELPQGRSAGTLFLVGLMQPRGGDAKGFDGSCREIALRTRAVPRAGSGAGDADELLGRWCFERGGDDVVLDRSQHANHAILGGGKAQARPTLELEDLQVSAGRFYAGGLLCENARTRSLAAQPCLPGAALPADRGAGRTYLFYLDAWERFVAPAQDPDLREPALGGADTAARTQVVAQARWLPIGGEPAGPPAGLREWRQLLASTLRHGRLQARRLPASPGTLGNYLYRVEVHGGDSYGWPRQHAHGSPGFAVESLRAGARTVVVNGDGEQGGRLRAGDWVELFSAETDARSEPGLLTQVEAVDSGERSVTLADPLDGFEEHHEMRLRRIGVLKWSRMNGSTALPLVHLEEGGGTAILGALGGDALRVRAGDWLEILDDGVVLGGAAAPLVRALGVDEASRAVSFDPMPVPHAGTRAELHPFLRQWDGVAPLALDRWLRLEHGIELRLAGGGYRSGDCWSFASRTDTAGIDWPLDASGAPVARTAQADEHHLSPLAVLRFDEWGFELRDSRPVFHPLATGAVSKAGDRMHGALEIRPEDDAGADSGAPSLLVSGAAQADTLLGSLGSPAAVETFNLAPGAVTHSRIAPDVGTVPPGFAILGLSATPPPGYEYTGCALAMPNPDARWVTRAALPIGEEPGELHSAAAAGRVHSFSSSGRMWSYDPMSFALEEGPPMLEPRARFAVGTALDKVYLVGGVDQRGAKLAATLEYDPLARGWSWRRPMPTPRCDLGLAGAAGKLHAFGGLRDLLFFEIVSRRNEVYDPVSDSWVRRRAMPTARYAMTAAGGESVFALGGRRRWFLRWLGRALSAVNEEYLPGPDRWERRAAFMPAPRSEGGAAALGDAIFVVGGRSLFGWSADVARFTPRVDRWEPATPLPLPSVSPGVASVDGRLIVHAAEPGSGVLEVRECQIAWNFHVHMKIAGPAGDLEPRLEVPTLRPLPAEEA